MFVLLFAYVFGGAIKGSLPAGVSYIDFLLPGIFVQSVAFRATQTAVGLSQDLERGVVDRFRSMPMARSAVLVGRTIADLVRNIAIIGLMIVVGYIIGFRFTGGVAGAVAAIVVVALFGLALSWIFAYVALTVKGAEAAQAAGFVVIFPLVFASSVFVPTSSMPDWLQAFAKVSPVTLTANTARGFSLDPRHPELAGRLPGLGGRPAGGVRAAVRVALPAHELVARSATPRARLCRFGAGWNSGFLARWRLSAQAALFPSRPRSSARCWRFSSCTATRWSRPSGSSTSCGATDRRRPPRKTLQMHVSHLRRSLGPDVVVTRAPGYVLERRAGAAGPGALRSARRGGAERPRRRRRRGCCARRWRCGGARRSPTSSTSPSRRARSHAWRSCAWRRWRRASTPSTRWAARRIGGGARGACRRPSAARAHARRS